MTVWGARIPCRARVRRLCAAAYRAACCARGSDEKRAGVPGGLRTRQRAGSAGRARAPSGAAPGGVMGRWLAVLCEVMLRVQLISLWGKARMIRRPARGRGYKIIRSFAEIVGCRGGAGSATPLSPRPDGCGRNQWVAVRGRVGGRRPPAGDPHRATAGRRAAFAPSPPLFAPSPDFGPIPNRASKQAPKFAQVRAIRRQRSRNGVGRHFVGGGCVIASQIILV